MITTDEERDKEGDDQPSLVPLPSTTPFLSHLLPNDTKQPRRTPSTIYPRPHARQTRTGLEMRTSPPRSFLSPSPSPRSSRTGDTGSTESKGAATRSMHSSILNRRGKQIVTSERSQVGGEINIKMEEEEEEEGGRSDSSEDEEAEKRGIERQGGIDKALESISSEEEEGDSREEGGSSWDYVSQTQGIERGELERERERREVERERSEFDGWLTASLVSDSRSSVDGQDAYDSLVDATRIVQVGLSRSRLAEHELMGSLISEGSEYGSGGRVGSYVRSQESSMFLFPSIVFEDLKESKIEVPQKVVKVEQAVVLPIPSQRRWKVLSAILGASLLLSLIRPYIPTVISFFIRQLRRPPPSLASPYLILLNSTSPHSPPLNLGTPLSVLSLSLSLLFLTSIPLSLHLYSLLPSSSSSPSRSPSPLLTMDPTSILQSRQLLQEGIHAYHLGHLIHSSTLFSNIISTNCEPCTKASAAEWLGRTLYRLSKVLNDKEKMEGAVEAFGRSIRMEGNKGSAWASRGRAKFHLGDWEGAAKDLRAGIKRDGKLGWAYEYLGKTMVRSGEGKVAEGYLQSALELDPTSYSTFAFYGEWLHGLGRNEEAKEALQSAISLRSDYPAAHARLSFLYTELLDLPSACLHLRRVLACRSTGYRDACLPSTTESMQGSTPYLRLYFLSPLTPLSHRIETLKVARSQYPNQLLIEILLSIQLSISPRTRRTALLSLDTLSNLLHSRITRYPNDIEAQGLSALISSALGRGKESQLEVEKFWEKVRGGKREGELAWVVMACFEARKGGRK